MGRSTEDVGGTGIQVIARAADILRALRLASAGLTQAEVAEHVGLARSTTHRLLNALEEQGLVESHGPRGRYRLGQEVSRLAKSARRGLIASLHPELEELSREVGETVDLYVLERLQVTITDQVVSPRRLRVVSEIGESFPLHCTASGKALLAAMAPHDLARATSGTLSSFTERTITDPELLAAELAQVRAQGTSFDREEFTEDICAVGSVIRGLGGLSVAVSIQLPARRFYGRETELHDVLVRWAQRVESQFSGTARPPQTVPHAG
jgi:DNA-binding IclR family transcriptional regulator